MKSSQTAKRGQKGGKGSGSSRSSSDTKVIVNNRLVTSSNGITGDVNYVIDAKHSRFLRDSFAIVIALPGSARPETVICHRPIGITSHLPGADVYIATLSANIPRLCDVGEEDERKFQTYISTQVSATIEQNGILIRAKEPEEYGGKEGQLFYPPIPGDYKADETAVGGADHWTKVPRYAIRNAMEKRIEEAYHLSDSYIKWKEEDEAYLAASKEERKKGKLVRKPKPKRMDFEYTAHLFGEGQRVCELHVPTGTITLSVGLAAYFNWIEKEILKVRREQTASPENRMHFIEAYGETKDPLSALPQTECMTSRPGLSAVTHLVQCLQQGVNQREATPGLP